MGDFSTTISEILNHGALNLGLAIGYRNRIFDVLEDLGRPVTVPEMAAASGLNERYLKEWLGIMVTGNIIELSPASPEAVTQNPDQAPTGEDTYYLPPEHASFLTRKAAGNNMGVYTQEIPLLTACALESVNCGFKTGEGVPFSKYPDFQGFMAELSDAKHEKVLIDHFLPSVDDGQLLNRLKDGIRVCDLGCGHGVAVNLMAAAFPNSVFTGIDNHEEAIRQARSSAQEMGLSNAIYTVRDAATIRTKIEFAGQFDYICAFDAIHDQSHPLEALKAIRYMLAPGGMFSMIDIKAGTRLADNRDHPMGPFLYTVSLMHCMPIGLNDNGTGLGMMWGKEKAQAMLREAGFDHIEVKEMEHDPFNLHFICKG